MKADIVKLYAKCIGCGKRFSFDANHVVQKGEHPICDVCGMPLVAEVAKVKTTKPYRKIHEDGVYFADYH